MCVSQLHTFWGDVRRKLIPFRFDPAKKLGEVNEWWLAPRHPSRRTIARYKLDIEVTDGMDSYIHYKDTVCVVQDPRGLCESWLKRSGQISNAKS